MTLSSENFLYCTLIKSICDNTKSKKEKERDVYMTMVNKDAFDLKKKAGFKFKHVLFFFTLLYSSLMTVSSRTLKMNNACSSWYM